MEYRLKETRDHYRSESELIYQNSNSGDRVESSQLLINEAFGKGIRFIEPEKWIPIKNRKDPTVNVL